MSRITNEDRELVEKKLDERKKNRFKKIVDAALAVNPIMGMATKAAKLLAGGLTPEKEDALESIISNLKTEEKEEILNKRIKSIKEANPAKMPLVQDDSRDNYPQFKAKGGEVKKYKKGGSVKKNKSSMITQRGWGASRKT